MQKVNVTIQIPIFIATLITIIINLLLNCSKFATDLLNNQHYFVLIALILLSHGDIESNPGPVNTNRDYNNNISILHCNIRSIRQKLEYIRDSFLDFDLLCFTETHLDAAVSDDFLHLSETFDVFYRKDRTNHGGGIIVYLSNSLVHQRMPELETFCNESIWI